MIKRLANLLIGKPAPSLRWVITACSLVTSLTNAGQSTIPSTIIYKTSSQYLQVENMGDSLFAITTDGNLVIWNLATLETIRTGISGDSAYHFLTISRAGADLWLGCADGRIYSYQILTRSLNLKYQCKGPIYAITVNSHNTLWIANDEGVFDPESDETWNQFSNHPDGWFIKQKSGNRWIRLTSYYARPQIAFLDSDDHWWLAARYGEFGGDLEIFNTAKRKILSSHFDSLDINLFFPQSINMIPGKGVLISSGLQHMSDFGELLLIDRNFKLTRLYSSWKLFIGPAAYNVRDSCIYFASGKGIHKARLLMNGKLEEPMLLFGTRLTSIQENKAVGQAMPVKQLFFTSRGLIFLTAFNGIGFYDGKGIYYLQ